MELWFSGGDLGRLITGLDLTIYTCNDLGELLIREGDAVTQRGGVLAASNRDLQPLLQDLAKGARIGAIVLTSRADQPPVVVRSTPLGESGLLGLEMWRTVDQPAPPVPDLGPVFGLTRGESALIRPLLRGLSNEQIARELDLSIETVRTHLKNACAKLGVSGRGAAVAKISGFLR